MRAILFEIPTPWFPITLKGYGVMLVVAMMVSTWIAARNAERNGGDRIVVWDLLFPLVVCGIIGARIFYIIEYWESFESWPEFFYIHQGGLVIYGGVIGAAFAFLFFTSRWKIKKLWMLDMMAAPIALGMGIGRIGCLLFGCCYGDYCDSRWAVQFPAGSPPKSRLVMRGHQTRHGFGVNPLDQRVVLVEPGSPAEAAGLAVGDRVVAVDGAPAMSSQALADAIALAGVPNDPRELEKFEKEPLRSLNWTEPVRLTVVRDGTTHEFAIGLSRSLPLHPTQIYSAIDGLVLFLVLTAYFPLRRRDGQVAALLAILYSISRFYIEFLRFDEPPLWDGLTISQNLSVLLLLIGLVTWIVVNSRPAQYFPEAESPVDSSGPTTLQTTARATA